jgi:hypothetical protein
MQTFGPSHVDPKRTSLHLVRTTGFAGVHPRKRALILNIRLDHALNTPRAAKIEQVSKHRYHNELRLEQPEQVDDELVGWLRAAYELAV